MTPLPGVKTTIGTIPPTKSVPGSTGTAFIVGIANRGPVNAPVLVRSVAQYVASYGPREPYGELYDTLDVAFHEGLDHAYVLRVVGPAAATAKKDLTDGASNTLEVLATSPGEWGNAITVEVTEGSLAGNFHLKVLYESVLQETSPELENNAGAIAWALNSPFIRCVDLGGGHPKAAQSITLGGGGDDRNNVTSTVIETALRLFTSDLGPGQVAAPGYTTEAVQKAVIAHCVANDRVPFLDLADTATAATLVSAAASLRSVTGAEQAGAFAPWDIVPGVTPGTTRTVPPCARQLGAVSRVDAQSGTADVPAAGELGKARYVIGLSQTYSPTDRESLNEAGVNVSIVDEGVVTTYGWRSLANPVTNPTWLALSTGRQMMAIASGAAKVLKRYVFKPLDAQGKTRAAAEGAIVNEVLKPAWTAGALYGLTEADAFTISVTQEVSPTDGSVGKLVATLAVRPTKFAEVIELTVVATNEAL